MALYLLIVVPAICALYLYVSPLSSRACTVQHTYLTDVLESLESPPLTPQHDPWPLVQQIHRPRDVVFVFGPIPAGPAFA